MLCKLVGKEGGVYRGCREYFIGVYLSVLLACLLIYILLDMNNYWCVYLLFIDVLKY